MLIWVGGADWGYEMSSIACAGAAGVDRELGHSDAPLVASAVSRRAIRLFAVVLAAASLAACAQSSVVSKRSSLFAPSRQASLQRDRTSSFSASRRAAFTPPAFAPHKNAGGTRTASQGIASFYTEGTRTASGEKFDTNQLTAAHPSLPFGTRLRVTNVATGKSVTVRVNDRGPYVPGRVVDVSYSAARMLGMVGGGVAKVKLDVVQ
jgi:peptidoglycan lytic transglycosylase